MVLAVFMKTTSFIMALLVTSAVVPGALAGDKPKDIGTAKAMTPDKRSKAKPRPLPADGKILLTGSYIKQTINRNGRITDGPSQVIILDRETIERSGASDLRQLLTRTGIH
jgi:outer membrane cobalamin receptor